MKFSLFFTWKSSSACIIGKSCHEFSRSLWINFLFSSPHRTRFVFLHFVKTILTSSDVQPLSAGPQMTTPYWCTLAPFRSLPAAANPAADDQSVCHASPPSPWATRLPQPLTQPRAPTGRPGMFQRFASALFGDDVEELSRHSRPGDRKEEEEEDEDWILVNYLGKSLFHLQR